MTDNDAPTTKPLENGPARDAIWHAVYGASVAVMTIANDLGLTHQQIHEAAVVRADANRDARP